MTESCSVLSQISLTLCLCIYVSVKERQNRSVSCHIEILAFFPVQFCFFDSVIQFLGSPLYGKPYVTFALTMNAN